MQTIAGVIERLDEVVAWAAREQQPAGYFAALYRRVTRAVADGIAAGRFDDGPRMERLDVLFAGRYLDAYDAFRAGRPMTESWRLAFAQTARYRPIVLQHLLGGMNAHINLDLGIAAATTAPGAALPALKNDFMAINGVLASLVQSTKDELAKVWAPLKLIDFLTGPAEDAIVNFSMSMARDGAWQFAERLAAMPETAQPARIAERDAAVARVGRLVYAPGLPASTLLWIVRLGERGDTRYKLDALAR